MIADCSPIRFIDLLIEKSRNQTHNMQFDDANKRGEFIFESGAAV